MDGMVRKGAIQERKTTKGVRLVPGLDVCVGQTIAGRYRIEELLGAGASGVVFSARSGLLREQVTLKILASYTEGHEELLERRLAKARHAARLGSTHVSRILDIGITEHGMPYVATEALRGHTLEAELAERGRLPVEEAVRWTLEACEGLAEAHASGLIHGDLKPANVFLHEQGGDTRTLKILDFGTTSPLDAIGDQSASAFFGSPAFLAPEQIQSPDTVDQRADVWALAVLLYNMVSGALPFTADSLSGVIVAVVYDAPGLLTDAPYELAKIVAQCLDKDPAKRPQSVADLAAALAPFAGAEGEHLADRVRVMLDAPPVSQPGKAKKSSKRSKRKTPAPAPVRAAEPAVTESTSISPVSISTAAEITERDQADSHEPLLLVTKLPAPTKRPALMTKADTKRVDAPLAVKSSATKASPEPSDDHVTRPSPRVVAERRQARSHRATFGILGAAAVLLLASLTTTPPGGTSVPTMLTNAEVKIEQTAGSAIANLQRRVDDEPAPEPPPVTEPTPPPVTAPSDLPNAPPAPISFAPSAQQPITPTPLATTPTPLATADGSTSAPPVSVRSLPSAPALPATMMAATPLAAPPVRPRYAPLRADKADKNDHKHDTKSAHALPTTTSRLPSSLPRSREPLPPYGTTATAARPAPRSTSSLPSPRKDESYLRKLFSDRK